MFLYTIFCIKKNHSHKLLFHPKALSSNVLKLKLSTKYKLRVFFPYSDISTLFILHQNHITIFLHEIVTSWIWDKEVDIKKICKPYVNYCELDSISIRHTNQCDYICDIFHSHGTALVLKYKTIYIYIKRILVKIQFLKSVLVIKLILRFAKYY